MGQRRQSSKDSLAGATATPAQSIAQQQQRRRPARAPLLAILAASALPGCAIGPVFHRPALAPAAAPAPNPASLQAASGFAEQRFTAADVAGDWWQGLGNAALSRDIAAALAQNPSLAAARATLLAGQERALAARAPLLPALDGSFSAQRQKESAAQFGANGSSTFTFINTGLTLSYSFDIWGAARRGVEAERARAEQARFAYEGAANMLAANMAQAAITMAATAAQIAAQQDIIAAEQQTLARLRVRFDAGAATGTELATQQAATAASQTALPPLRAAYARAADAYAAYQGLTPAEAAAPAFTLSGFTLPHALPRVVSASLLEQRPDVRSAEAALHAATAALGIARANRLPAISLSANAGTSPARFEDLFSPGAGVWTLGGNIAAPLFHGGELLHAQRAAEDDLRAAAFTWRDTAIGAMRDVSDVLSALEQDAQALHDQQIAYDAAQHSYDLARVQFDAGAASYLAVLAAQSQAATARQSLISARAARLSDCVALYVALGGGWWHRAPPPEPPSLTFRSLLP